MPMYAITKDGVVVGSVALTDADDARVAARNVSVHAGAIVQTPAVAEVRDGGNNIVTRSAAAVMRDPTANEALSMEASNFFSAILGAATDYDRQQVAKAAADAIAPIVPIT